LSYWFQTRWFLYEFPIGSYVKLSSAVQPSWSEGGTTRHNFGRRPSNDYSIKVWFQLSNWFQTRRFLGEFPIGSYVKLRSAVEAILVEGPNRHTFLEENHPMTISSKFSSYWAKWFQTRRFLWEFPIGSHVKLSSAVAAILVGGLKWQTHFGRGLPKDHFSKIWLRLAQ
jgi:hypothetical protein